MKLEELKKNSVSDLHKVLQEARERLLALRFAVRTGQSKKVRDIRSTRKTISRVLTLLNLKNSEK